MNIRLLILTGALALSAGAQAGNSTLDAAIGGGIGAAIGNEIGGREGAVLGGAIGAAVGTSGSNSTVKPKGEVRYEIRSKEAHPEGYHCPPGQAKKGRC